jgi:hypothetical protein
MIYYNWKLCYQYELENLYQIFVTHFKDLYFFNKNSKEEFYKLIYNFSE